MKKIITEEQGEGLESKEIGIISNNFKKLGFKVLKKESHKNTNGPDLFVIKKDRAYSVEIKKARQLKLGQIQVGPVEKNRVKDDFIAIMIGSYVLIEPMKDHLKLCSGKGYRNLTLFGR